jgi:periplasmic divalent cation tolerance protein
MGSRLRPHGNLRSGRAREDHAREDGAVQPSVQLGVFVYGTLRPGSWNHGAWLAEFLAGPCRPARLDGFSLHHHAGLPAIVPDPGRSVVGEIADLDPARYHAALRTLDVLEGTAHGHYLRETAVVVGGEEVWLWVAGDRVAAALGQHTLVDHGDWLAVDA